MAKLILAAGLGFAALSARAAHTQASLLLADTTAQAGSTVLAGIHLRMDPGWHTYWRNSGASGIPTTIKWELPAGITAGETEWPVPEKLPPDNLTTYVYENDVVLLVPLKLARGLAPGLHELKARLSWLECDQECIPGKAVVTATIDVATSTKPSTNAPLLATWRKRLPQSGKGLSARAWWEKAATGDRRPLMIQWDSPKAASEADFYPQGSEQFEVQGATERLPANAGEIRLQKVVKKYEGDWPKQISGLLIQKSGNERLAYEVTLAISGSAEPKLAAAVLHQSLWVNLLYAFLGGMILNLMPCVLPVIALKILGFVSEARNDPRHVRWLGVMYALGVLVSFLVLAGIVIAIKAAGHRVGWGFQFGNPYFLIAMTILVVLIALNLFGVFDVSPGARALNSAGALASRGGASGAFLNGLVATVLATACTAPVLGTAVGYAFQQSPTHVLAIMLMVGLGLAAPYVVLSLQPAWLKFLPKPGPWMEKFKVAMGFPMLAAGVWLCYLVSTFYGDRTWGLAIFLVFLASAAWVFGQFFQRSSRHRGLALVATLLLLLGGYTYALQGQLRWREPIMETVSAGPSQQAPTGGDWLPWSQSAVSEAQAQGRPVLVDFTAKWCLTCQKDVKPVLESGAVRRKLEAVHAVTLLADYTRFPDNMTRELNRYNRAGVPLVLVYPGKSGAAPVVLPELLTPGMVVDALDRVTD